MINTVYVLSWGEAYEGYTVIGVHLTKASAEAQAVEHNKGAVEWYAAHRADSWIADTDESHGDLQYIIETWPVQS